MTSLTSTVPFPGPTSKAATLAASSTARSESRPTARPVRACELDAFTTAYLECALWSSTGEDEQPLDDDHSTDDIALEALQSAIGDCRDFQDEYADMLLEADLSDEQAGHDFWLTRNGHGAGFWDRGLGVIGDRLSKACKAYGTVHLCVGDDGKVYGF